MCFLLYLFFFKDNHFEFFKSFIFELNVFIFFFKRYNPLFIENGAIGIPCITNLLQLVFFPILFRYGEKIYSQTCLFLIRKSAI